MTTKDTKPRHPLVEHFIRAVNSRVVRVTFTMLLVLFLLFGFIPLYIMAISFEVFNYPMVYLRALLLGTVPVLAIVVAWLLSDDHTRGKV